MSIQTITGTINLTKRKTPRPPIVSIYLGDREKRLERLEKIDAIAAQFGITRSVLMQKIADGELVVSKAVDFPKEES
jgi:hypothetical protein